VVAIIWQQFITFNFVTVSMHIWGRAYNKDLGMAVFLYKMTYGGLL